MSEMIFVCCKVGSSLVMFVLVECVIVGIVGMLIVDDLGSFVGLLGFGVIGVVLVVVVLCGVVLFGGFVWVIGVLFYVNGDVGVDVRLVYCVIVFYGLLCLFIFVVIFVVR